MTTLSSLRLRNLGPDSAAPLRLLPMVACAVLAACQTLPPPGPPRDRESAVGSAVPASPAVAPPVQAPPDKPQAPVLAAVPPTMEAAPAAPAPPGPNAERQNAPDTWGRLRRGFAMPALDHPLVDTHAQRFAKSSFFEHRADRLRLYLPLIVAELESRQMPLELALLPLVESALNPHARSSVGALGTWQFMAPTARRFELRTSRLVDDRKNLVASTRAAIDYLQRLHQQFGDWHLAMAAYNWGEGRVQSAVNRQRLAGLPADFNALAPRMPAETRNYVPQILALRALVANPGAHGVTLPDVPDGNPLVEVALRQDVDLSLALKWTALSEKALLAMNPAIKHPLILSAATPRLLMPEDAARRFEARLAAHAGSTANWRVVRLPATQPVEAIAAAYGAQAGAVRAANDIQRGTKPVAGSVLLLPVAAAPGARADEGVVATAQISVVADLVKVKTKARAKESLTDVARRCAVGVAALAGWNQIARKRWAARLKPGATLVLWVPRERSGEFAAAAAQSLAKPSKLPRAGEVMGRRT
jgi:membrane-bound lytic murein transglycosylase D